MRRAHQRTDYLATCVFFVALSALPTALSALEEMTKEILAVQLRRQGYDCAVPVSAQRDEKASEPNETVWVLTCENATYRMKVIPDMGATVKEIQKDDQSQDKDKK